MASGKFALVRVGDSLEWLGESGKCLIIFILFVCMCCRVVSCCIRFFLCSIAFVF